MSVNIRDYVSNDHIESIGEIARSQSSIIQALSIDNSKLERENKRLHSIIKEVREYIKNNNEKQFGFTLEYGLNDKDIKKLLEILDKEN